VSFLDNFNLKLGRVIAKPIIAVVIISKVDAKKEILNIEKISAKRKMKVNPKIILKLVFTRKSKELNGSVFLLKAQINLRIPEPTKYRIRILRRENRTESNKVIPVQSHHIITLPQLVNA
jgi:hypothetical protein